METTVFVNPPYFFYQIVSRKCLHLKLTLTRGSFSLHSKMFPLAELAYRILFFPFFLKKSRSPPGPQESNGSLLIAS